MSFKPSKAGSLSKSSGSVSKGSGSVATKSLRNAGNSALKSVSGRSQEAAARLQEGARSLAKSTKSGGQSLIKPLKSARGPGAGVASTASFGESQVNLLPETSNSSVASEKVGKSQKREGCANRECVRVGPHPVKLNPLASDNWHGCPVAQEDLLPPEFRRQQWRAQKGQIPEISDQVVDHHWHHHRCERYLLRHKLSFAGLSIAMSLYHHDIIVWLEPKAKRLEAVPAGFLAPIGILVILSFPPLLGHEVVGILLGIVYGLWIGFAIFAAGTLLGEIM
jgi:hypothetical protein